MSFDIWVYVVIIGIIFFGGTYFGFVLLDLHIKRGLKAGILEYGHQTYRVSKFVARNTRV